MGYGKRYGVEMAIKEKRLYKGSTRRSLAYKNVKMEEKTDGKIRKGGNFASGSARNTALFLVDFTRHLDRAPQARARIVKVSSYARKLKE